MSADPQAGMEIDGTSANGDPSTGTKSASINMNTINSDINNDNESESDDRDSNLIDITDLINETCKSLTYANPLICKESFNLYDSMSALDLMEPKMDGCQIPIDYYTKGGTSTGTGTGIVTNGKKGDKTVYVPPRPIPKNISQSSLVWKLENEEHEHDSDHERHGDESFTCKSLRAVPRHDEWIQPRARGVSGERLACVCLRRGESSDSGNGEGIVVGAHNPRIKNGGSTWTGGVELDHPKSSAWSGPISFF